MRAGIIGLEAIGFNQVEFSEFDSRRLSYGEYLKKNLESKVEIYGCDYRDLELGKYDLIFVVNAVLRVLALRILRN